MRKGRNRIVCRGCGSDLRRGDKAMDAQRFICRNRGCIYFGQKQEGVLKDVRKR